MHLEQQVQLNNASYLFYLLFIQQVRNPQVDIAINLAIVQTNVSIKTCFQKGNRAFRNFQSLVFQFIKTKK